MCPLGKSLWFYDLVYVGNGCYLPTFLFRYSIDWKSDLDSYFDIDPVEGTLSTNELLDRESIAQHNISIVATKLSKYDNGIDRDSCRCHCPSSTVVRVKDLTHFYVKSILNHILSELFIGNYKPWWLPQRVNHQDIVSFGCAHLNLLSSSNFFNCFLWNLEQCFLARVNFYVWCGKNVKTFTVLYNTQMQWDHTSRQCCVVVSWHVFKLVV